MKQALVTGGAGFIGSHMCASLVSQGYNVYCVDNFLTGSKKHIESLLGKENFHLIEEDVVQGIHAEPEHIDYVFHLASPASPNHHSKISYHAYAFETMMVNTQGTLKMLELAEKHKARFIFSSTSEIYGDPLEHPQKETYNGNVSTTGPRSVYDEAKRFGETLVAYFYRTKGVNARIARIFNTYGTNMRPDDKRMLINFILQALNNEDITVYGDGSQTRSLCYVDDMVAGLQSLMFTDGIDGEIINIGTTEEHTVKEYAEMVRDLCKSQSNVILSEELPKDDPLQRKPDITKAKELLHWEAQTSLEDGLMKTIEYFKSMQNQS